MALTTIAAQPRLSQRQAQSGNWAVPDANLEGWDSSWVGSEDWEAITVNFDVLVNRLVSVGGRVDYSFIAKRTILSEHDIFRISFANAVHSITTPQVIGELAIITETTVESELVRQWARYPLVGVPEGRLETIQPAGMNWPTPAVGDVVQFYGTWFI